MKKHNGMTLVSVIVGFAILLIGISMFYGIIQISNNILSTQKERTEQTEQLINEYYKKTHGDEVVIETVEQGFDIDQEGLNTINLERISVKKIRIHIDGVGELYYYEK